MGHKLRGHLFQGSVVEDGEWGDGRMHCLYKWKKMLLMNGRDYRSCFISYDRLMTYITKTQITNIVKLYKIAKFPNLKI